MTRCVDFYRKWEKDPNWCEKTRGAVSQINSYLELVTEISSRGIDKEVIYAKFPETAARPVISIKDPDIRAIFTAHEWAKDKARKIMERYA